MAETGVFMNPSSPTNLSPLPLVSWLNALLVRTPAPGGEGRDAAPGPVADILPPVLSHALPRIFARGVPAVDGVSGVLLLPHGDAVLGINLPRAFAHASHAVGAVLDPAPGPLLSVEVFPPGVCVFLQRVAYGLDLRKGQTGTGQGKKPCTRGL